MVSVQAISQSSALSAFDIFLSKLRLATRDNYHLLVYSSICPETVSLLSPDQLEQFAQVLSSLGVGVDPSWDPATLREWLTTSITTRSFRESSAILREGNVGDEFPDISDPDEVIGSRPLNNRLWCRQRARRKETWCSWSLIIV